MSSLSNKSFDLAELKPLHPSLKKRVKQAHWQDDFFSVERKNFFLWLAKVQGREKPSLVATDLISFAGDHGIHKTIEGPKFRSGDFLLEALHKPNQFEGFSDQRSFKHYWVDLGVDYQFESNFNYWLNHSNKLINSKVKPRTESFDLYPAMTDDQLSMAFYNGRKLVDRAFYQERDLILFHSLGEGQLASVYALAWALSISDCKAWEGYLPGYFSKARVAELLKSTKRHPISHNPFTNLCFFGGFEIVSLVGAQIRAAEKGIPFLLADPASIIAWQYAALICPGIESRGYAIGRFAKHLSNRFGKLKDNLSYSPEGEEWYPFHWQLLQEIRRFNQK
jgi:hypothetical protein